MLTFDPGPHVYRWNGKVVPSVSEVIRPLYLGAFDNIPADVLERKRAIGHALHKATELYDLGTLDMASVDPAVVGYLNAYLKAAAEQQFQWRQIEQQLCNPMLGFAGTVDRMGYMRAAEGPVLVDFKTVVELHDAIGVQLAGYARLANVQGISRWALQLLPDGNYRLREYKSQDDDAAFMGCLAITNWRRKRQ